MAYGQRGEQKLTTLLGQSDHCPQGIYFQCEGHQQLLRMSQFFVTSPESTFVLHII